MSAGRYRRGSDTVTISEGHTLSVVALPVELGHRFTVNCTCGEAANTDYAFIANLVPTIHRMDLEAAAGG